MKYVRVPNLHMKRNMIEACHCCVHQCQSPKWRMLSTYIRRTIILEDVRQRNMEGSVLLYMKLDRWRVCLNFSTCFSPKSDHRSQHTFSSVVAVISHETFIYTSSMRSPYKFFFFLHPFRRDHDCETVTTRMVCTLVIFAYGVEVFS